MCVCVVQGDGEEALGGADHPGLPAALRGHPQRAEWLCRAQWHRATHTRAGHKATLVRTTTIIMGRSCLSGTVNGASAQQCPQEARRVDILTRELWLLCDVHYICRFMG